jgi:hypothetical protein
MKFSVPTSVVTAAQLDTSMSKLIAGLTVRSRETLVAVKDYLRTAPAMEPRGAADYAGNLLAAVVSSARRWPCRSSPSTESRSPIVTRALASANSRPAV